MIADYRKRFWVSMVFPVPILVLSPMIQSFLGLEPALAFPGDVFGLLALASIVYFYGGWSFITGLISELRSRQPGMMTLIAWRSAGKGLYHAANGCCIAVVAGRMESGWRRYGRTTTGAHAANVFVG